MMHMDSVELAGGQLGAVLAAPRSGAVELAAGGPWLATTPALVKAVLTDPANFDFPGNVSRDGDLSGSRGDTRSGHTVFAPVRADDVARSVALFGDEWRGALLAHERATPAVPYDAMRLLRSPVARSTAAAVIPGVEEELRNLVADRVLAWVDALGPIISATRQPRRWSSIRREERRTREALEDVLATIDDLGQSPQEAATVLAAGTQVPIAAGSFLIAWLAQVDGRPADPMAAVWETLRLTPPTWLTARVTTREVVLGDTPIPGGRVVFVSPLLLGRHPDLVPEGSAPIDGFDPGRWENAALRPGAWLPFGAGPHACPGRNLGLAMLLHLAQWASAFDIALSAHATIDQSRGIAPSPCHFTLAPRGETTS